MQDTAFPERVTDSGKKRPAPMVGPVSRSRLPAAVAIAYACMALFGLILLLIGSLLPTLPHLTNRQAGDLGSCPLLGILLSTVFTGPLLERFGARPVLAAGLILVAAPLAAMPLASGFGPWAAAALAYGLGGGVLNTASNALVAMLQPERRGAALNRLGAFFSLGAVCAPLLMSFLLTLNGAHAVALGLWLLALLTIGLLVWLLRANLPAGTYTAPGREQVSALRHPLVWGLGLILFFESGNENALFVWGARLADRLTGTGPAAAEWVLVGLTATLGLGRWLVSYSLRPRWARPVIVVSAALVVAGLAIAWRLADPGNLAGFACGMGMAGFGLAAIYPTVLGVAGDRFAQSTGTVFSAIMTLGLLGGVLAPRLAGWLAASGSRNVLLAPLAGAIMVGLLGAILARPQARAAPTGTGN